MIELTRRQKYDIHLRFDADGARRLAAAFRSALNGRDSTTADSIRFDRGIVKGKRFDALVERELIVRPSDDESIAEDGERVILALEPETLEYGIEKLEESLTAGEFFPAELCELNAGKRNELNQLYCIFIG